MNVIFIAAPAAGKGTQSSLLEEKYGYAHISTGDLLRAEIKKGTELGTELENIILKGELVSDEIITKLLQNEINNLQGKNFILDGYPRNIKQAEILSKLFEENNMENYRVIYLELDKETAMKRALGRIVCSKCGASYNKYFQNLMPKEANICDKCHGELIERTDDNEESFNNRFDIFKTQTSPLLDFYKEIGKLFVVNASLSSTEIFNDIEKKLEINDVDNA